MPFQLRPAEKSDLPAVQRFINGQSYLHRHLDWRDTLEWLGHPPFFLLQEDRSIGGVFACPPEPDHVAWLRLFGVAMNLSLDRTWEVLFSRSMEVLRTFPAQPALVSLSFRDWYEALLKRSGFTFHQEIVVFAYDETPPPPPVPVLGLTLRDMLVEDLAEVVKVDHLAFEPIWQLSPGDMQHAYLKSSLMTVAEMDGQIIGYQMSSTSGFYAHLARLAVHPNWQRQGIGYVLVQHLLEHFLTRRSCWSVTLNTQHNNPASISFYHRLGFRETGERFPVYVYPY